jgi:outer membrane protein assembly factor BamB
MENPAVMNKFLLLILDVCLLAVSARADGVNPEALDNWPHWRGPLANGVAPRGNPPIKWDEKTNVKWKTEIPGSGSATPIVWGDRIFVLTAIDTGRPADPAALPKADPGLQKRTKAPTTYHQFVVLCIDRHTGQVRWRRTATEQVPHEGHHPTHSYAAGSPTTDGRFLYVSFGSFGLFCYDLDGKLQWQRNVGRMSTRLGWGEAVTPVLHGDTLMVNWDQEVGSFIVALDARTGKDRWKVDRDEAASWNTPLVVEHQGRTQVIVNGTNLVRSYDLATGEVLWQCGGQTTNAIPSPVADDRFVYCMSGYRGAAAFAIPLDARGDVGKAGKAAWNFERGTPYVPSPLLVDGRLYFTQANNALLTCLDARTGKPIIDRQRLSGLATLYASPVEAADRIYIADRSGTTLVLKRGDKIEVLATNRLDEGTDASPVIVGKQLFLRAEKHLYCLEAD